jgi:hypothetical protein
MWVNQNFLEFFEFPRHFHLVYHSIQFFLSPSKSAFLPFLILPMFQLPTIRTFSECDRRILRIIMDCNASRKPVGLTAQFLLVWMKHESRSLSHSDSHEITRMLGPDLAKWEDCSAPDHKPYCMVSTRAVSRKRDSLFSNPRSPARVADRNRLGLHGPANWSLPWGQFRGDLVDAMRSFSQRNEISDALYSK